MVAVSNTAAFFQNSSTFSLNELLKYVQENGADPLWTEPEDSFEDIITIRRKVNWGKQILYTLCVDPGGGAMSGKLFQGGGFAPGDRTRNIQGQVQPKHQTMTYQYDNFTGDLTNGEINAYVSSVKQEYDSKNSIFKSALMLQLLGDGTSRQGTPIGFGDSDVSSGATFTLATNQTPMRIKMSMDPTAAGSAAWFVEGQVISILYIDRDLNDDGTNEVTAANGKVRFVSLSFDDAGAGTATQYDAFRIVRIKQSESIVEVMPARVTGTVANVDNNYSQPSEWVSGGTGVVTVTPYRGRTVEGTLAATDTVFGATINDVNLIIGAALTDQYQTVMHPGYVHSTQAEAKLQLGLGWTSATEMSSLSKYVPTGLDTLLTNVANTVHGINRASILQHLPTVSNANGRELTFNTFLAALTDHQNRNKKQLPEWSVMYMNPLVESSLIALSEASRILIDGPGVRGKEGKVFIQKGGKKFQFETSSCMRQDKIYCVADGTMTLYDGAMKDVNIGGVSIFPQLVSGSRVDVSEKYTKVTAEMAVKKLRLNMVINNFKTTALR
jgi:hypothetical protein